MCITCNNELTLNLYNIANFIPIDDTIIGLKYLIKPGKMIVRGEYNGKLTSFQSQISLVIALSHKRVNVKIFRNGSVQITGCKRQDDGMQVYEILHKYFLKLDGMHTVKSLSTLAPNVFVTNDDMVVSGFIKQVIGYVSKSEQYVINNNAVTVNKDGNYLSVKSISNRKTLYDKNGKYIGNSIIELMSGSKKLYTNKLITVDYINDLVYFKDTVIGKIRYNIQTDNEIQTRNDVPSGMNYSCSAFMYPGVKYDNVSVIINCINISVNLGFCINRQKLYDLLVLTNVVIYDPNSYSAIRLVYTIKSSTNVEYNVNCLIFQSGNVILTGIKSIEEIDTILDRFSTEIHAHKSVVAF